MMDIGKDLQNAYEEGYKQGRYDEKVETEMSLPKWIPVSERLPKPFEHCLWTTVDGEVVYHHFDGAFSNYTAWIPLPKPYGGEQQ